MEGEGGQTVFSETGIVDKGLGIRTGSSGWPLDYINIKKQTKKLINGYINLFPNKDSTHNEAKQTDGITFTSMFLHN